jgi:hypothetical protein
MVKANAAADDPMRLYVKNAVPEHTTVVVRWLGWLLHRNLLLAVLGGQR